MVFQQTKVLEAIASRLEAIASRISIASFFPSLLFEKKKVATLYLAPGNPLDAGSRATALPSSSAKAHGK